MRETASNKKTAPITEAVLTLSAMLLFVEFVKRFQCAIEDNFELFNRKA